MHESLMYFWVFLKGSFFSTGGLGNLPIIREDLLRRHLATERQFAESLAVAQLSPGPTGLWVVSFGYLNRGWLGALFAIVAISLPPFTVAIVRRVSARTRSNAAAEQFVRGFGMAGIGLFLIALLQILHSAGLSVQSAGIAGASAVLVAMGRVPVPCILLLAAVEGVITHVLLH